jgi:hypothetical protein
VVHFIFAESAFFSAEARGHKGPLCFFVAGYHEQRLFLFGLSAYIK